MQAFRTQRVLVGPPGSGKTMLARRIASILPPLCFAEALEVTKIRSISAPGCPLGGLRCPLDQEE